MLTLAVSDRVQDDKEEKKEVPVQMRKRITLLFAALTMALTMAFSGVAFAVNEGPGKGNPDTAPGSGTCPAGQNKDTSVGGLKKCP